MDNIVSFETAKLSRAIEGMLMSFLDDPVATPFQKGFLAALLSVYEMTGKGKDDGRITILKGMISSNQQEKQVNV